jgi:hypothetical protein
MKPAFAKRAEAKEGRTREVEGFESAYIALL